MANANPTAGGAQDRARKNRDPVQGASLGARTRVYLPARMHPQREAERAHLVRLAASWRTVTVLIRFYEDHPGARWSVRDLAAAIGVDPRTVRKGFARIPSCGYRLIEEHEGSAVTAGDLPVRRWVERVVDSQDQRGRPLLLLSDLSLDLSPQDQIPDLLLERQIPRTRARTRARAVRERRPHAETGRQRRRARPPVEPRRADPVGIGAGVWAALVSTWGTRITNRFRHECRLERYHVHPAEAELVARTMVARTSAEPLRLWRYLFRRALAGDVLIDRLAEAERVRDAEDAARRLDPLWAAANPVPGAVEAPSALRREVWDWRKWVRELAPGDGRREPWGARLAALEARLAAEEPGPAPAFRRIVEVEVRAKGWQSREERRYLGQFDPPVKLVDPAAARRAKLEAERAAREAELDQADAPLRAALEALDVDALDADQHVRPPPRRARLAAANRPDAGRRLAARATRARVFTRFRMPTPDVRLASDQ